MADVVVNVELKYRVVKKDGNKEISQRFLKDNISVGTIDEMEFMILGWVVSMILNDPGLLFDDD